MDDIMHYWLLKYVEFISVRLFVATKPNSKTKLQQLRDTDDLGLTLPFLAVYYDRPDMLKYLRKRGFDLSQPCDPMNFGNTMFYAISLGSFKLKPFPYHPQHI